MVTKQRTVAEFQAAIDQKELQLLQQQDEVLAFISTKHTADDAKEYLAALRKSEAEINKVLAALIKAKPSAEFRDCAEALCAKTRDLKNYTRDMNRVLTEDIADINRKKDEKKLDWVKIATFGVAFPLGLANTVRGVWHTNDVDTMHVTEAGYAIGSVFAFKTQIKDAFKAANTAIAEAPHKIRYSATLCYVRMVAVETCVDLRNRFHDARRITMRVLHTPVIGRRKLDDRSSNPEP